jgi:NAD+ diphosphatase
MSPFDLFPLGEPAFVSNPIDRAAHLRFHDDKLMALESHPATRAYVLYRDSLLVKREGDRVRALLTIDEALKAGANPGTIFLGLRDGAAVFGMGMSPAAAEALAGRDDTTLAELRGMAMEGAVPPEQLGTIAMAKSMVSWHQRHGFCASCGTKTAMREGGWKRECPACKTEHFPRTDPVVISLVASGDKCLLGRQKQFPPGMYSCLAGFVEAAETIEDAVRREIFEESGIRCAEVTYYMTQPWPYPSSLMIGCNARALNEDIVVDHTELEDARWFSRDEARQMLLRQHPNGLAGPHPFAIAHHLVGRWLHGTETAG